MLIKAIKPFKAPHKMVQPGEVFDVDSTHGQELMRNGLAVEHKMQPAPRNKMMGAPANKSTPVDAGKVEAAGEVQPSSVLQAAPASLSETLPPSVPRETLKLKKKRGRPSKQSQ